jgi:ceramide glucosyltransferase
MDWEALGIVVLALKFAGDAAVGLIATATGVFTVLFSLAAVAAAYRMSRRGRDRDGAFAPPVTILKPLKGCDRELYENLRTFCRQDYPSFQLLFTLATPDDPALPVLARLKQEFPDIDLEIIVSKNRIGFNPKVNNVSNAAPFIKHEFILMSDSDIKVRPDFLRRAVATMADPEVGLATCFYQSTAPKGLWTALEALSVNAQFLPQAVTAAAFGMRFAMGAAILVRRAAFEKAGGFAAMADHLADDFILGESVRNAGYKLEIASPVVESVPDVASGLDHLRHQARWARTIRICNPAGYLGSVMLHGFSLLTLKCLLYGPDSTSLALGLAIWAAKALCEASVARLLGRPHLAFSLLLIPLSEWVSFCAWVSGYRSNEVLWRGELYTIREQGRLIPVRPPVGVRGPIAA